MAESKEALQSAGEAAGLGAGLADGVGEIRTSTTHPASSKVMKMTAVEARPTGSLIKSCRLMTLKVPCNHFTRNTLTNRGPETNSHGGLFVISLPLAVFVRRAPWRDQQAGWPGVLEFFSQVSCAA